MDATSWNRRLASLLGQERRVQVEFLLALAEFAERRLYLDLGYSSLWDYCMRGLHLREGATFLRTHAIATLRRFPALAEPLRDGRLCLSTVVELSPVLTEATFSDVLERAAHRTRAEVKQLVASLAPKPAPEDSLRRAPAIGAPAPNAAARARMTAPLLLDPSARAAVPPPASSRQEEPTALPNANTADGERAVIAAERPTPPSRAPTMKMAALSGDEWLLRMRLSDRVRGKLETARALASHSIADGSWEAVLEAALDCYIERMEKRRAAKTDRPRAAPPVQPPASTTPTTPATSNAPPEGPVGSEPQPRDERARAPVPASVRRAVWARDGGCCAFTGPDGTRCGSRHRLELDHVVPIARGGPSTVANLRLLCRRHNVRQAEHLFGEAFMRQFERGGPRLEVARQAAAADPTRSRAQAPT